MIFRLFILLDNKAFIVFKENANKRYSKKGVL